MLAALSGILLNHRALISGIDLPRNLLPSSYRYQNGNQAAIRGGDGSAFLFGDSGIWKKEGAGWVAFNGGLPRGADRRKVLDLLEFQGTWVAATQFGLYRLDESQWEKVALSNEARLADLFIAENRLAVLTRSELFETADLKQFDRIPLPAPAGYRAESSLFRALWLLHSGELFGTAGKCVVDGLGVVLIILCVTGLTHFLMPKWIKKRGAAPRVVRLFKRHRQYHLQGGWIFGGLLGITILSGMFLRPPLLIPIANKQVPNFRFTKLDNPNPWHEQLRKGAWDAAAQSYLLSTRRGFFRYYPGAGMEPVAHQPPVSVMGCTLLKPLQNDAWLVGSFSGLYMWNARTGQVLDFFTRQPARQRTGRPVSANMISGLIESGGNWFVCDYRAGVRPITASAAILLPPELQRNGRISLWALCLEVHTGRIFEPLLGPFYILYVPLLGLAGLFVLGSGFVRYIATRRKKP